MDVPHAAPWLIALPECPSTSTWALERHAALAHGACVHTPRQTAGRGRQGRVWHAPRGVLTASWLLRFAAEPSPGPLALACGLALLHAVEGLAPGLQLAVKWPNDLLLDGRKLAGLLCESPRPGTVVVGVGLNLAPCWEEAPDFPAGQAASLAERGPVPATEAVLAAIRRSLLEAAALLERGAWPQLLAQVRARDALLGRHCAVEDAGCRREGEGAGLDDDGALRLRLADGRVERVLTGHVEAALE